LKTVEKGKLDDLIFENIEKNGFPIKRRKSTFRNSGGVPVWMVLSCAIHSVGIFLIQSVCNVLMYPSII
jgi:hypothetical protein